MTTQDLIQRPAHPTDPDVTTFVAFLSAEFPEWAFEVDATETWNGDAHTLWIATRDGHHPQSALTGGKLYRRLFDYEARVAARNPGNN